MEEFSLSDAEFDGVRQRIYRLTGISLSDAKRSMVVARLQRLLRQLKLSSFEAYFGVIDAPGTAIAVTTLDLTGALVAAAVVDGDVGTDLILLRVDASIGNAPGFAWWRIVDRRQIP